MDLLPSATSSSCMSGNTLGWSFFPFLHKPSRGLDGSFDIPMYEAGRRRSYLIACIVPVYPGSHMDVFSAFLS
jgi:hypothetical protein